MNESLWPEQHRYLDPIQHQALLQRLRPELERWRQHHNLPESVLQIVADVDLHLAAWLAKEIDAKGCRVLGLCGGQGSGKSTRAKLLELVLTHGYGKKVVALSLDDIYLSRSERQQFALNLHPLFITRGVPGTHDPLLGQTLLRRLRSAGAEDIVLLPVFDKAIDDRLPEEEWRIARGPIDLVIFEGWCVGARPQPDDELLEPINELERYEDVDGSWRRFVNDELSRPYVDLFAEIDILMLLKVPGMRQVFEWRKKQEEQLRSQRRNDSTADKVMDESELRRFIQHYERITRSILAEMPSRADLVFKLNERQQVVSVTIK